MAYDKAFFEQVTDRYDTVSAKWDGLGILYGNPDMSPMWIADMDFKSPVELTDAVLHKAADGLFGYGVYGWCGTYRQTVAEWHQRRNGIAYDPESITFSASALRGIVHLIHGMTEKGDGVAMFTPVYGHFYQLTGWTQRTPVCIPLHHEADCWSIDYDAFEQTLVEKQPKILIFCNPCNPVGRVWTHDEIAHVLEICMVHNVTVVSDEVHSDLIMPGFTFTPALAVARELGCEGHVAMTHGLSKTFNAAGLQVGYTVATGEVAEAIKAGAALCAEEDMLNCFGFQAVEACLKHGDAYVDGIMEHIVENNRYARAVLAALPCADKLSIAPLEGTYLLWIELKDLDALTSKDIMGIFVKNRAAIQTEDDFYVQDGKHYLRVNIAMPMSQFTVAVERLANGMKELYGC